MKKNTKLNFQDFSTQFMNGDTFKRIVVDQKLLDFPYDKVDNKFDYIKEVTKYKDSIFNLGLLFYLLTLALLTFSTGTFTWNAWNLLFSLLITYIPFGVITKYANLAAQHQSLIEKSKPFIEKEYEIYLKE